MTSKSWLAAIPLLAACASAPPATAPVPAAKPLAYAMPAVAMATYAFSDSSAFDIQAGAMGTVHAAIGSVGTANITFAGPDSALKATVHITQLAASMSSSQGGGPSASEADVQGDAVLSVTPRGAATVISMPKVTETAQRAGISEGFYRRFFVRLPANGAHAGQIWVDTVATTDDMGETKASVRDIVTSTLVGDTVLNGRTLAHIKTSTERTLNVSGINQGMQIAQKLSGKTTGVILWDRARGLLIERTEQTQLSGTFDLPQMGLTGLPVTAHGSGVLQLR